MNEHNKQSTVNGSAGPARSRGQKCPRGFTLVELLVVMAVTLILIFALAQTFAVIGDMVAEGRATIEMNGNLRAVANQLQQDLDGVTVPARPLADADAGLGYLEIVEGPLRASLNPSTDKNPWGTAQLVDTAADTIYGDMDDVIAFTSRSPDMPFMGQYGATTIKSPVAEIVWWIQFEDLDNDGQMGPEEKLLVYRRVLLVRPDLGVVLSREGGNAFANNPSGWTSMQTVLENFFNENDISVRMRCWVDSGGNLALRLTANSLADLTKRENRFAHLPILSDRSPSGNPAPPNLLWSFNVSAPPAVAVPYDDPYDGIEYIQYDHATGRIRCPGTLFPLDVNRRSVTSLYRSPKWGNNYGEDVMVADALAFDVQVYDPMAPVRPGDVGEALVPGDPGYFVAWADNLPMAPPSSGLASGDGRPDDWIGLGAFVDLGYGYQFIASSTRPAAAGSLFSNRPLGQSRLRCHISHQPIYAYDTWSAHYERNGVDEDNDGLIDEANNGFDDQTTVGANTGYFNGVDDPGERETSPPYPVPLRGVQIKIRAWDPGSRQVKQVAVVSDFLPE